MCWFTLWRLKLIMWQELRALILRFYLSDGLDNVSYMFSDCISSSLTTLTTLITWTTLTTWTILTTWKTWTTWTTLTTLTDQRFIKKMIATFALFTWSSLVQVNSLNQQILIIAKNICQLLRLPLSESVSISKELCVRMWRDEIKLNNRNTVLGNKHRINCNNDDDEDIRKVKLEKYCSAQLSWIKLDC